MEMETIDKMYALFKEIWDEREDEYGYCYCFETGTPMHWKMYRHLTTVYDHVLPKSKYKQYMFLKKNIVIILPKIHTQKTHNINKTPKLKEYRDRLLSLHNEDKLINHD